MLISEATVGAPANNGAILEEVPSSTTVDNVFIFESASRKWKIFFDGGITLYRTSWLDIGDPPADKTSLFNIILGNADIETIEIDTDIQLSGTINVDGRVLSIKNGGVLSGTFTLQNAEISADTAQIIFNGTPTLTSCESRTGKWHPTWFGATGDGSTDDFNALNKCITTANSNIQKTVNLIPGNYLIESNLSISSGVILQFEIGAYISGDATLSGSGNFDCKPSLAFGAGIIVSGIYPISGEITPQAFGAMGNNSTNDAPAINRLFAYVLTISNNLINVYFPPKLYYVSESIVIPNVRTPNITVNILGYGTTIRTDQDIVIWKRMPTDNGEANDLITTIFVIKGFRILGDSTVSAPKINQIGMQFGALYTSVFSDLQFEYVYDGLHLQFALGCEISNIRVTLQTNNAIVGRHGSWSGATFSNSSFNGNMISNCRVFNNDGAFSALYLLAADQTTVDNFISEGFRAKYDIYYNYAGNTTVNINTFSNIWFESAIGTVYPRNTNFFIRSPVNTNIINPQADYNNYFLEIDGVSGGWQIVLTGLQYIPFGPPAFKYTGGTDGIITIRECRSSIDAIFRDPAYWENGIPLNTRIEGRYTQVLDPDSPSGGYKEYTSGHSLNDATASNIFRSYSTNSGYPIVRIERPSSVTSANPLLLGLSNSTTINNALHVGMFIIANTTASGEGRHKGYTVINSGDNAGLNNPTFSSIRTGGTLSSPTAVPTNGTLFEQLYFGYTTAINLAAFVRVMIDGTPTTGIVPGRYRFYVTSNSGASIEAFGIRATGKIELPVVPSTGTNADAILTRNAAGSVNIVTWQSVSGKSGSYSANGDGTTTTFSVTHGFGTNPSQVLITPTNAATAIPFYVTNKNSTTFDVVFTAAPATGTGNVTFDWLVK